MLPFKILKKGKQPEEKNQIKASFCYIRPPMEKIMKGTVFHQHEVKKVFSVQLENGDYSVVEIVGNGVIAFGDMITGLLDNIGPAMLTNQTTLTHLEVMVHAVQCTRVEALQKATMV